MKTATAFAMFVAATAFAAFAGTAAAEELTPKPCMTGLTNPCGITVQPGTDHLFISDSGAGRILGFHIDDWHYDRVIVKFAKDVYGKGPTYDIGPLGLAFVGKKTLVVGGGDQPDGKEVVYFYDVPPHGKTIEASAARTKAGPIEAGASSAKGEGNFFGVAVTKNAVFVTSNGDDAKGWILKASLSADGTPGELKPFIATKEKVNVDAPAAVVVDAHGHLVVGQMGEVNVAGDSLLTIYDAASGELISSAETGLNDVTGLAYGPKSGKLYAVDFSWIDPKQGGLFRLELSGETKDATVKATKLCSLDKPAAMCFGPDGALYVAEFGTAEEGSKERPGRLVKIEGDL